MRSLLDFGQMMFGFIDLDSNCSTKHSVSVLEQKKGSNIKDLNIGFLTFPEFF
jgi:hypothetical protein